MTTTTPTTSSRRQTTPRSTETTISTTGRLKCNHNCLDDERRHRQRVVDNDHDSNDEHQDDDEQEQNDDDYYVDEDEDMINTGRHPGSASRAASKSITHPSTPSTAKSSSTTTSSKSSFLSFRHVASCLTDAVTNAAIAVANEIALLEERMVLEQQEHDHQEQHEQEEQEAVEALPPPEEEQEVQEDVEDERQEDLLHGGGGGLPLPWDVDVASSDVTAAAAAITSEGRRRRNLAQSSSSSSSNNIPIYMTDESLMNEILELSKSESTFRLPFRTFDGDGDVDVTRLCDPPATTGGRGKKEDMDFDGITSSSSFTFVWNDVQVQLIRRLLDIDPNLSNMFTKLCKGKDKESRLVFWKNYFYHCHEAKSLTMLKRNSSRSSLRSVGNRRNQQDQAFLANDEYNTMVDTVVADQGMRRKFDRVISSLDDDDDAAGTTGADDGSLIPVSSVGGDDNEEEEEVASRGKFRSDRVGGDDSSYVLASPPTSLNTYLTTRSVDDEDDVVLVNR